ncbi:carboxypeptidase-like regulatory domain-containing protein [Planctomycetaceae bacterium SH139]
MSAKRFLFLASLFIMVTAGCGPGGPLPRPEGVQVSGKVLSSRGKPLSGGTLILRPEAGLFGATAIIQSDGSFTLRNSSGSQEVVPGRYQVFVTFPNPDHQALIKTVNERYQQSEDGNSDVFVDIQQATSDLTIELKR